MYSQYWQGRLIRRRKLLAGAGMAAIGATAAAAVGCSSESNGTASTRTATSQAAQARRGGHLQIVGANASHLDPALATGGGDIGAFGGVYSRMWQPKAGGGQDAWDYILDPDLAVSVEQPDKSTYVYKLRQGVKWQDKPPLNARAFVADDVVYAIRRAVELPQSVIKGDWSTIDTVRAIDPGTVEIKTKTPWSPFNGKLGGYQMWIAPREVVENPELKNTAIGTGPFLLDSNEYNVTTVMSRNPNYYGAPQPYVDKLTQINITDYSAREAAFTTGKIDLFDGVPDKRSRDKVLSNAPDAQSLAVRNAGHYFYFRCDRPPFQDVRMRQAFALTVDYDGLIQAFAGGDGQRGSTIPQGLKEWAVPPSQWGEGAKYHSKPDLAEAKKLMDAAGFSNGADFDFYNSVTFVASNSAGSMIEAVLAGALKVGFRGKIRNEEYAIYSQRINGQSEYAGMVYLPTGLLPDPDDWVYTYLYPGAKRYASFHKDPELDALILKQRQEFDKEARKKILLQIEQRNLLQNYFMPVYDFNFYCLHQKRVQNYSRVQYGYERAFQWNLWLQT